MQKIKQIRQRTNTFWCEKRFFSKNVSFDSVWKLLIEKILLYNIDQRATAVAYNFTLAVFPTVLFFFTLIPYFPIPNLEYSIMNGLRDVMPLAIYEFAAATIYDIISRKSGGILSFGFILAMLAATNGMSALITAFNMTNQTKEKRGYFKAKGIALLLTLLLALVIVLSVLVIFIGGLILNYFNQKLLPNNDIGLAVLYLLRYFVMFGAFWLAISIIYRFAPTFKHGWRLFNVGSFLAALLIVLATYGFSYYLSDFGMYNKLYGSIGTMIALMIWFYLIALLLIFGFELNVSLWRAKYSQ